MSAVRSHDLHIKILGVRNVICIRSRIVFNSCVVPNTPGTYDITRTSQQNCAFTIRLYYSKVRLWSYDLMALYKSVYYYYYYYYYTQGDNDVILFHVYAGWFFCRHLVGKNSKKMFVTVTALKCVLLVSQWSCGHFLNLIGSILFE